MKVNKLLKTTTDSRTYKLVKRRKLNRENGLCYYCGPHSGCNSMYRFSKPRNWKRYRKTQYKLK